MIFEATHDLTLDNSVPIIVRSDEDEYIVQFALKKSEILDLQKELKRAINLLRHKR